MAVKPLPGTLNERSSSLDASSLSAALPGPSQAPPYVEEAAAVSVTDGPGNISTRSGITLCFVL